MKKDDGNIVGDCEFCPKTGVVLHRVYDEDAKGEPIIEYACTECEHNITVVHGK